jgi:hypothetical protein
VAGGYAPDKMRRKRLNKKKAKEAANSDSGNAGNEDADVAPPSREAIKEAYREQMLIQAVEDLNIKNREQKGFLDLIDDGVERDESLLVCQEYLQQTVEREEFDCESVISSYSTTDNHPSKISVGLWMNMLLPCVSYFAFCRALNHERSLA